MSPTTEPLDQKNTIHECLQKRPEKCLVHGCCITIMYW